MNRIGAICALSLIYLVSGNIGVADAQNDEGRFPLLSEGSSANFVNPDFGVPQSPAFTVLGLAPQNATNPATPKELGAALINGFDVNGNFQNGIALDTNPYFVLAGEDLTIRDYQDKPFKRVLANTQVSFATTSSGGSDEDASRIAMGLHVTPWISEDSDPRRNRKYIDCLIGAVTIHEDVGDDIGPAGTPLPDSEPSETDSEGFAAYKGCKKDFASQFANPTAWTLGVAPTFTSEGGSFNDLDWSGAALWTTVSVGLPDFSMVNQKFLNQFIVHGRYRADEMVPVDGEEGRFVEQDSATLAARYRLGGARWNTSLEGAYIYADRDDDEESYFQATLGSEFRILKGIWLEVSAGRTFGRDGEDDSYALANFKWNFAGSAVD